MTAAGVRVGVGTRVAYDGELLEVTEVFSTVHGVEVLLLDGRRRPRRMAVRDLLTSAAARILAQDPESSEDDGVPAATLLDQLSESERKQVRAKAAHVREVLTGYRSGSAELALPGEPRAGYEATSALETRYATKCAELGIHRSTIIRWVSAYRAGGEAALASGVKTKRKGTDYSTWTEIALEIMAEYTPDSPPSRKMVIARADARLKRRYGEDRPMPSRATGFRILTELEDRLPTFDKAAKRNREIAERPRGVYGKLRPTRPGEYVLMDTTRLDVFGLDPVTLQWLQVELTVAMDWYTRCIVGLRVTPVSTKAIDAAATLYQVFRPKPAGAGWPAHAVWPDHGIPRSLLLDPEAIDGPMASGRASPALAPETIVVDHGKIYVSDHLTSVCARFGISIQPARLRTGRDKGPVERFFRTIREDLLQHLPGYKGPDLHKRGENPEADAFFFLSELDAIIREWVALVYHHRCHRGLVDAFIPGLDLSPAAMFQHGVARAGYIEVPRDRDLAYHFLKVEWRTIQHYGIDWDNRRYNGEGLNDYRNIHSPYGGKYADKWPIYVDEDDITRVYFQDYKTKEWSTLTWEHAPNSDMPLSRDAMRFGRKLAASKYRYPDDQLALADLLDRWKLGLAMTKVERRIALRTAREQAAFELPDNDDAVPMLPSVRKALGQDAQPVDSGEGQARQDDHDEADNRTERQPMAVVPPADEAGDDDDADLEGLVQTHEEPLHDFYDDALEDV
ncbi:Mu transposase C-terminal domain-containing protein [Paractinoplanes brasiliensis]|uniref:Mu transposase-like protein n=1 Tax=Paractinoplanes brasiliensis TaxID=52695 RepID=A0A4V3C832_9ACTN|nr:Mu transposase C-terminal domain-containing protein [Actinoplanes brasiliensis]TDO39518.1 Mu transposase-like protein [Actinoplanes brasiliensis]GID29144.1 integrase/transposase [Actinoplanes brasiliensis]